MKSAIILAAALLTACGAEPNATPETSSPGATDNATATVAALSEPQRRIVFLRAIRDAGLNCQGVTATVGLAEDPAQRWRATCTDGRNYLISVSRDGTAHIVAPAGD